jgi:hypothetical protein
MWPAGVPGTTRSPREIACVISWGEARMLPGMFRAHCLRRVYAEGMGSASVWLAVFGLWPKTFAPRAKTHQMVTSPRAVRLAGGTPA